MTRRTLLAGAAAAQTPPELRLPRRIRLAMIGLEGHTAEVLRPLRRLPDLEIAAVCDPDERAMARIQRLPQGRRARTYKDWRQLLDREKPDMVATCGPNGERPAILLACAERKIDVVAEKPLAVERADFERIRRAVAEHRIRLTMLLPMRFLPSYQAMKQAVDSGEIGEVAQIGAQKSYKLGERPDWMRRFRSFGGTIPYIGVHMVDLMRYTSGRDLVETFAYQNRIGFPDLGDMENTTASLFKLDNGGTAALRMDYLRPETAPSHGDDRLRLAGTGGIVEFQESTGVTIMTRKEKPRVITALPPARSLFIEFLEWMFQMRPSPGLTLEEIYRVNEIVLAARESAEQHRILKTV